MLKRDFLMAQINKFTETVARAILAIEKYNLTETEETIQQNFSENVLDDFLEGGKLPDDKLEYETILFQLDLLFVKIKLLKANGQALSDEKGKYLRIANLVLNQQKDFNLNLQSRVQEVMEMN